MAFREEGGGVASTLIMFLPVTIAATFSRNYGLIPTVKEQKITIVSSGSLFMHLYELASLVIFAAKYK